MHDLALLILQAKQGDVAAYSEIVRRFQDTAVGYAYGILGNHDAAKDAAQEAFIEAYACLGELREPRAFAAWLRRIIFKQCDRITRRRALTTVPLEVADQVPTSAPGPVEIYEQRELQTFVANALQQLPEEQRARLMAYGGDEPMLELNERIPSMPTTSRQKVMACGTRYLALGWSGHVPEACRNTIMLVPVNAGWLLWGWPNLFFERMERAGSRVFVTGPYGPGEVGTSGIDSEADAARLPEGFSGGIWTNRIDRIGPAFKAAPAP